jgi:hypothetical protein
MRASDTVAMPSWALFALESVIWRTKIAFSVVKVLVYRIES